MAKIKVFYTEGFNTWIVKEPIEIDTKDYPELEGLSKDEIEKYLDEHAHEMKSSEGEEPQIWSLYEQAQSEDDRRVKEYNHETNFQVEIDSE